MNPKDKTITGITSYPSHKTISLVEEKTIANREAPPAPVREVKKEVVAEKKPETAAPAKNTYPAHKTFSLTNEQPVISEIKKEITESANKITNPATIIPTIKDSVVEKASNFIKEQPVIQKIDSVIPSIDNPLATDQNLKDSVIEKAGNFIKEQPVIQKIDSAIPAVNNPLASGQNLKDSIVEKAGNVIKDQPVVQKVEAAIKTATSFTNQQNATSYPAHKTVSLEPFKQETTAGVKEEQKAPVRIEEPALVAEKKTEPVVKAATGLSDGTYPAHKTHSFVKEELTSATEQDIKPVSTLVAPDSNERVSPQTKAPDIKKTVPVVTATSSKKPVLWIAASGLLLLASAATAWYAYQQKKTMQEEIVTLKQSNEVLAENVKKLQKDLYVDDIIARAGKLDAKNNITVIEDANASEVLRTCFSVIPNAQSKKGKKTVYIRFMDAAGNVLLNGKENVFEYKGEKIPYSAMQQIDYKGAEMMLCVDFKPSGKLQKGTYKAELYNDGVKDGIASFELK